MKDHFFVAVTHAYRNKCIYYIYLCLVYIDKNSAESSVRARRIYAIYIHMIVFPLSSVTRVPL